MNNAQKAIEILLTIDDSYLQMSFPLIHSIFQNNPNQNINIHVIHCGELSEYNIHYMEQFVSKKGGRLYTYFVNLDWLCGLTGIWNKIILLKLYAWEVLKGIDKVLFLDADTLVVDKLDEVWNIDLGEYYFAGVHLVHFGEISRFHNYIINTSPDSLHLSAGVLLYNLRQLRSDKADWKEYYSRNFLRLFNPDEDVICALWYEKIKFISHVWNFVTDKPYGSDENPKILHFGRKPWVPGAYQNIYLKYCNLPECQELYEKVKKSYLPSIKSNGERLVDSWFMLEMNHSDYFERYFIDKGIINIAVYGIGRLGKFLTYKVFTSRVATIKYYIDAYSDSNIFFGKKVVRPEEVIKIEERMFGEGGVDAIIVTPGFMHFELIDSLEKLYMGHIKIISIAEIIYY